MSGNKYLIILFFVFCGSFLSAQDTIYYRNGERTAVKVEVVGVGEIKYHKLSNLQGPLFISSKNDISKIKYASGGVDTFSVAKSVQSSNPNASSSFGKLSVHKQQQFIFNDRPISDDELKGLIQSRQDPEKRNKLLQKRAEIDGYAKRSKRAIIIGYAVGIPLPVFGTIEALYMVDGSYEQARNAGYLFLGSVIAGAAIRITGCVVYKVNKNKAANAREQLAQLYNTGK